MQYLGAKRVPQLNNGLVLLHLSDEKELIPVGVVPRLTIPNNSL